MNCEEFRLKRDGAGNADFDGAAAHVDECAECRRWASGAEAMDARLRQALAVPVPTIEFEPPVGDNVVEVSFARNRRPMWYAMAAAIALAAFLGFRNFSTEQVPGNNLLAEQVLEHMIHEPYSRVVTSDAVSSGRLESVVRPASARVDDSIGLVSYAKSCEINGKLVPHLVVQGESGPVTIMIMAGESIAEPVALENDQFHGTIIPVGDGGSVAIIGRKGESIDDIRAKVGESIRLSI